MKTEAIRRISSDDGAALATSFEAGPDHPFIITGAVRDWPALGKWNLDFFASEFRHDHGVASLEFQATTAGKMTKLGAYIQHLDEPFSSIPGVWVGRDGRPSLDEPRYSEDSVWGFHWDPFRRHPELFRDISPYPAFIPNLVARLDWDVLEAFQKIFSVDLHSIYISRAGTITTIHRDFHHTIGSLVQFQSEKTVFLFRPEDYGAKGDGSFDPEHPDFDRFPEMANVAGFSDVLGTGELLIIPPDWWHYTRSHDHSLTLSHNFFNHVNFSAFMRCVFKDLSKHAHQTELLDRIKTCLDFGPGAGN